MDVTDADTGARSDETVAPINSDGQNQNHGQKQDQNHDQGQNHDQNHDQDQDQNDYQDQDHQNQGHNHAVNAACSSGCPQHLRPIG